jgi:hypothetical protein
MAAPSGHDLGPVPPTEEVLSPLSEQKPSAEEESTDLEGSESTSSADDSSFRSSLPMDEETWRHILAVRAMLHSAEQRRALTRENMHTRQGREYTRPGPSPLRQVYTANAENERKKKVVETTAFDQARKQLNGINARKFFGLDDDDELPEPEHESGFRDPGLSLRGPGFAGSTLRLARPLGMLPCRRDQPGSSQGRSGAEARHVSVGRFVVEAQAERAGPKVVGRPFGGPLAYHR